MQLHRLSRTRHFAAPTSFMTNGVLTIMATILIVTVGILVRTGNLPWLLPGDQPLRNTFPVWGRVAFGVWMLLAGCISLLVPCITLIVWRNHADVRAVLVPYMGMLLIQIPTEMIATQLFFPNITVIVGITYTCYRLYQLWYFRQYVVPEQHPKPLHNRVIHNLLWIGLWFWTGNLVFLLFTFALRMVKL